jgi:intracellular sulfur oxidation DsrE/DsrF family protein
MRTRAFAVLCLLIAVPLVGDTAPQPVPQAPVIPAADGYAAIPGAALRPGHTHVYHAIFDATLAAAKPDRLLPALNMAGSELNALGVEKVRLANARFVVVFHGDALAGILDDVHYRARFGIDNPNLSVLAQLRKAGVKLYACGQNLIAEHIDPAILSPDVQVASDALLVLMVYQNRGYALMSY